MANVNQGQSSGAGATGPASSANPASPQGGAQARPSAMRETTHVKAATRCAMEKQVRTTIDLKRPWYYSA